MKARSRYCALNLLVAGAMGGLAALTGGCGIWDGVVFEGAPAGGYHHFGELCLGDEDCADGLHCGAGVCRTACASDADCDRRHEHCAAGVCIGGAAGFVSQPGDPGGPTATCGNGLIETGEGCDDGDLAAGDGCGSTCQTEANYACSGEPSVCACATGMQDKDGDGRCLPTCATANLSCGATMQCDDANGTATCVCRSPFSGTSCATCLFYVDSASSGGDGSSWANAKSRIQQALDAAATALTGTVTGTTCDVLVREGVYNVYDAAATDTLTLKSGVRLFGGCAGTESAPQACDASLHESILDGASAGMPANRVYHVLTAATQATVTGFVVRHGNATGSSAASNGGGLYCSHASDVALAHITFSDNTASAWGGAIYADTCDRLSAADARFVGNSAAQGGAVGLASGRDQSIVNATFSYNAAALGGALSFASANGPVFKQVVFAGNRAAGSGSGTGGAIYAKDGVGALATLTNVVFVGNSATMNGGAIDQYNLSLNVTAATFSKNQAATGGAIALVSGASQARVNLFDTVFSGDVATTHPEIHNPGANGNGNVRMSDIVGGCSASDGPSGTGGCAFDEPNMNVDPQFASVAAPSGTWTSVTYSPATRTTTLSLASGSWSAGALRGRFVIANTGAASGLAFPILGNDATSLTVAGDLTAKPEVSSGNSFLIFDLHLASSSPCIDAGLHAIGLTADVEGTARGQHLGSPPSGAGGAPEYPDVGAYEFPP
jgi:cysteine-rich repeat protein/predicted outer membrane repeat protein